jgi:hypothetical protein
MALLTRPTQDAIYLNPGRKTDPVGEEVFYSQLNGGGSMIEITITALILIVILAILIAMLLLSLLAAHKVNAK